MNDFEEGVELVHALIVARERGSEIETKAVNVHVVHPVAQAVHDELKRARMEQIERVARPGEIQIEPRIFQRQSIVGRVIHSTETERGSEMISFRGVIVNHVQDHFDAGRVEIAHHPFELGDLLAHRAAAGVLRLGREETDRVVAPVIAQAAVDQNLVVDVCVDRQQLHRRDAEVLQIFDRARAAQARVRSA